MSASIFENNSGTFLTASIKNLYTEENGAYQTSTSFTEQELTALATVALQARARSREDRLKKYPYSEADEEESALRHQDEVNSKLTACEADSAADFACAPMEDWYARSATELPVKQSRFWLLINHPHHQGVMFSRARLARRQHLNLHELLSVGGPF